MKFHRLLLVVLLLSVSWCPCLAADSLKLVDSFSYDWMRDGKPYEFILDIPSDYDSAGDFTRLRINRAGRLLLTVRDDDGFTRSVDNINERRVKELISGNPTQSQHLLFTTNDRGSSKYPLLFLFGCAYASSPGGLYVVALGNDGIPKVILHLRTFQIADYCDLNGDGKPELVGKPCLSQSLDDDVFTYDPYHVYTFGTSATSPMRLDVSLSKKYNIEHYCGWAGMKCREDVVVLLHPPGGGKPAIMDAKRAEALLNKKDKGKVVPGGDSNGEPDR